MKRRSLMVLAALVFSATPVVMGQSPVAAAGTCIENFNNCKVGDVGPGGGIVYYDAGSMQWWGRFLEAKTTSTPAGGIWGAGRLLTPSLEGTNIVELKQLGMGLWSSGYMRLDASSVVARLKDTAFSDDFYLPSKDELDALYNYWKISGDTRLNYKAAPMWSSTEASATFAWYQLFQDGTQFTDANGIIKDPKTTKAITQNKAFSNSPKHTGSDFEPTPFQVIGVRSFPRLGTIPYKSDLVVATTSNDKCSNGGAATVCKVGDIGPGGGIVFYDAGKEEYWGRYLEIAPQSCEGVRYPWRPADNKKTVYTAQGDQTAAELRVLAKGMGMGKVNTRIITLALGAGKYAAKYAEDLVCGERDDWFLPSKDELDTAYNRLAHNRVGSKDTPIGGFNKGYYWTSSDYNNATAWSQYFMDGQQFDRVQKMDGNRTPPTPFRVRAIRAFGTNTVVLPCAQGGSCKIGDTGPGGGKVFYVAPDFFMVNGKSARYLEASPQDSQGAWCKEASRCQRLGRLAVARDSGAVNTSQILNSEGVLPDVGELIKQGVNGKFDWYVPSIDELIKLNRQRDMVGGFRWDYYWSSSFVNGGMLGFGLKMHRGNAADEVLFRWEPAGIRLIRAFG
jgi:hypothetical protein